MVKLLRRITGKKGRDGEGLFLVEGANLIGEAMKSGAAIRAIIRRADGMDEAAEGPAPLPDIERVFLAPVLFDGIAETVTPKPVMAVVEIPEWDVSVLSDPAPGLDGNEGWIVMDRLQDPGNAGAMMRTADAAGFRGVIAVKGTVDLFSGKAVRAAAGAVFRLPVIKAESGDEALDLLRINGIRSVACRMDAGLAYDRANLTGKAALIIGNEGRGLSDAFIKGADMSVRIPMSSQTESLNAAIAAAVLMFEKRRQDAEQTGPTVG